MNKEIKELCIALVKLGCVIVSCLVIALLW